MKKPTRTVIALLAAFACAALPPIATANPPAKPSSTGGPPQVRRLSEEQYRNSIADIFGPAIRIEGRFEGELPSSGLLAIGSSKATVTTAGAEYYANLASDISAQIVAPENRAQFVPCTPRSPKAPDADCARAFVVKYGEPLFRRPLAPEKVAALVGIAERNTRLSGDFHTGLRYAMMSLLIAPDFIFRVEVPSVEAGGARLDDWTRASRLSFLLWNGPPDAELLAAARRGDLSRPEGRAAQVDRMMASPKLERSLRAFFSDAYGLHAYETLAKDGQIYPNFSQKMAASMREQELRTIIDVVLTRDADYREVFTTRKSFLNRDLGYLYQLPVQQEEGWTSYEMPENRAGILTWASFLSLHAHPGRSSPTLRGVAIRERFLCQEIPAPPADVDFSIVQDIHNTSRPTARARLTAHMSNPTCAGCHKLTDPIGFGLEQFDGAGQFRAEENGVTIDPSGALGADAFKDAVGLGQALAPQAASCLVNRLAGYGLGRVPVRGERLWVEYLKKNFLNGGMRVKSLLRELATSEEFYKLEAPRRADGGLTPPTNPSRRAAR